MPDIDNNEITSTLARELLKEKRSDRRWKTVRSLLWFALIAYIVIGIFTYANAPVAPVMGSNHVALIRLDGMIAPGRDFSAEEVIPNLLDAFTDKNAVGIVIDINSPGGTPVQASIIHDAIVAYKKKYHKKVVIVGEDLLASGAYFVAVAGDQIYVNPNSIVGSVGVIVKGFGFVDAIKKLGIERRVYTAGTEKDRMDPFLPVNPDDQVKIQQVMGEVHQNFVQAVKDGRKGKLNGDDKTLFSGDFWSGQTALKLGLVDKVGNLMDAMQQEFNTTTVKEYGEEPGLLRLLNNQLSSSFDKLVNVYF